MFEFLIVNSCTTNFCLLVWHSEDKWKHWFYWGKLFYLPLLCVFVKSTLLTQMRNILLKNISKNSRLTWQTPFFLFIDKSFFSSSSSSRSPLQCLVNPDKKTPFLVFFLFHTKEKFLFELFCMSGTHQAK